MMTDIVPIVVHCDLLTKWYVA